MKELTIEEKAQRYDEAIKIAREINNEQRAQPFNVMTRVFRELKESSDEEIRKELLQIANESEDSFYMVMTPDKRKRLIAWLEKQGKHINFLSKIQVGDKVTRNKDGVLVNLSQLNRVAKPAEKQCKKLAEKYNITGIKSKHAEGKLGEMIKEMKSTHKVEPKFKVGDWVVTNYGKVNQVIAVDEDGDGFTLDDDTYFSGSWKDTYHLWTIQDAKDGDVLCTYECCEPKIVFILKGTPKKHYALSYHCYYNIMYPHFGSDSEKGCLAPKDEDVKPATKEQRDILMKAMADAGYTFDFEKKELKKIEQKSVAYVPKFHVGDKLISTKNPSLNYEVLEVGHINELDNLEYKVEIFTNGKAENPRNIHYIECHKLDEWAKLIKQRPTELNEEDEKNRCPLKDSEIKVGDIITYFKNGKKGIMLVSSFDSGTYPRCKWGISHICGTAYGNWAPGSGPYYAATEKEKQQLYDTMPEEVKDWFKSLRPQPKQKWSEEDEEMCYKVTAVINKLCAEGKEYVWSVNTLIKLFYWLKSLKERYTWKPTEEQMKQLGWIAEQNKDNIIGKELMTLYNDLKQLKQL